MKFSCGLTYVEKMRRQRLWHRVFRWWPVSQRNGDGTLTCYALCYMERKLNYYGDEWEYRLPCGEGYED